HHLVEQRLLFAVLPQQAAETLDVLADGAAARQDDADVGRRHIDTLVEDATGDNHIIIAGMEGLEDVPPLLGLGLVRDGRHEIAAGDRIDGSIIISEYKHAILPVTVEQFFQDVQLGRRRQSQATLLTVRLESGAAIARATRLLDEALPAIGAAQADAVVGAEL